MSLEIEPVAPDPGWADTAWAARRGEQRAALLEMDSATGQIELRLLERGGDGGAGAALLGLLDDRPGKLLTVVPVDMRDVCQLLEASGFATEGEVWQMVRAVAGEPEPVWPQGVSVRTYDDDRDAVAVHALLVRAFTGLNEVVAGFEPWHARMTGDPEYHPDWWWLAEADGQLVGAALCWTSGWLKDLAVDPDARGRGIGEALCRHAFHEMDGRGMATCGLKVDAGNVTGAVRLYRRVGMQVERRYRLYVRP
jgi:ribosomal protein S18 acetylase RimI-like enzyme